MAGLLLCDAATVDVVRLHCAGESGIVQSTEGAVAGSFSMPALPKLSVPLELAAAANMQVSLRVRCAKQMATGRHAGCCLPLHILHMQQGILQCPAAHAAVSAAAHVTHPVPLHHRQAGW